METTLPEIPPSLQEAIERYQQARSAFETARDAAARIAGDLIKHQKSAEASETEAQAARLEAANLMRNAAAPLKQIRDLKAKERAAYTQAEDYRGIVADMQLAVDEAKLNAGSAKSNEHTRFCAAITVYADVAMKHAAQTLGPLFAAMELVELAYALEGHHGTTWGQLGYDSPRDAMHDRVRKIIQNAYTAAKTKLTGDKVMGMLKRPNGLDAVETTSPVGRHVKRIELEKRKAELLRSGFALPTSQSDGA
ncbi:hypothetical protein OR16_21161 [Cupriavidus basilensis OR16]|uniref:Uncharacterized protein n=1 Tax=Cupriavidus basilensis OR16 TaxID=1127483 RepID=H1S8C9_9BURK|nr:hypothetical protein [Cupriavidus basilensis]EHP41249.1 hypothetical protein OR16_21161 [Cupriavidus basilensis OR16]